MTPTLTFLLAEDDPNDLYLIEHALKRCPEKLQWRHVRDGVEGQEYFEGNHQYADRHLFPLPDVVLMDLKMPRLNGFDFLQWLRHEGPFDLRSTPVVVLTSSRETSDVTRAYELGANSYLVKPARFELFAKIIRELTASWSQTLHQPAVF